MPKVHTLDIYECDGSDYCIGCVDANDEDSLSDTAGSGSGAGSSAGASSAGSAGAADYGDDLYAPASTGEGVSSDPVLGQSHLIEVQVVNAAGVGQGDIPYEVILPDGSTRFGSTSADGYIRLSVSPHTGNCTIRFPEHEPAPS